ncbi:MAG: DsbA family oxidoreductase [Actinomycetota bacterium]|nr:DsbA family oxidoreductase [Actinomycetota bacterium]
MRIEIWSDIVCPWCYVGKRRLERALAGFAHAEQVEIVYRSFELDPGTPQGGGQSVAEHLGEKYGGGAAAGEQMVIQMTATAAEEGLQFDYQSAARANTVDAHRLLHLALAEGGPTRQAELKERLLKAYFTDARAVDDPAVLTAVAAEAGLSEERVAQVLASEEYLDDVHADVDEARALGVSGVPFFVIDRKYAVSGAQPAEVFGQALTQAWSEAHPVLTTVGGAGADSCGPDGCAV